MAEYMVGSLAEIVRTGVLMTDACFPALKRSPNLQMTL